MIPFLTATDAAGSDRRALALWIAFLVLGSQLYCAAHLAFEQHHYCEEHGEHHHGAPGEEEEESDHSSCSILLASPPTCDLDPNDPGIVDGVVAQSLASEPSAEPARKLTPLALAPKTSPPRA